MSTANASEKVDGSATVGPEPTTERSSPTTSETASVTIVPLHTPASLPPEMLLKCFRTTLSSRMSAPLFSRSEVVSMRSPRLTPGTGSGRRLELPPETMKRQVSLAPSPAVIART